MESLPFVPLIETKLLETNEGVWLLLASLPVHQVNGELSDAWIKASHGQRLDQKPFELHEKILESLQKAKRERHQLVASWPYCNQARLGGAVRTLVAPEHLAEEFVGRMKLVQH